MNIPVFIIASIIIIIIVILLLIKLILGKSKYKSSYYTVGFSKANDPWKEYAEWMHSYVVDYIHNPNNTPMNNYNNVKNDITNYYISEYDKNKVIPFIYIFDRFVRLNMQNIQFANGEPVSLPDNGYDFANAFARMANIDNTNKINEIANIWLKHMNNIATAAFALQSGNNQLAQTTFINDLALVEKLNTF